MNFFGGILGSKRGPQTGHFGHKKFSLLFFLPYFSVSLQFKTHGGTILVSVPENSSSGCGSAFCSVRGTVPRVLLSGSGSVPHTGKSHRKGLENTWSSRTIPLDRKCLHN